MSSPTPQGALATTAIAVTGLRKSYGEHLVLDGQADSIQHRVLAEGLAQAGHRYRRGRRCCPRSRGSHVASKLLSFITNISSTANATLRLNLRQCSSWLRAAHLQVKEIELLH